MPEPDRRRWAVLCKEGHIHCDHPGMIYQSSHHGPFVFDDLRRAEYECQVLDSNSIVLKIPCDPHHIEALAEGWTR